MAHTRVTRCVVWSVLMVCLLMDAPAWAETVIVRPSNAAQLGWVVVSQTGMAVRVSDGSSRPSEAVAEFVAGYESPPAGSGSLHLFVGSGEQDPLPKVYVGTNRYVGVRLDRITQFKVWVCPRWWEYGGAQPVTLELAISKDGNLRLCTFYPWGSDPTGYYGRRLWREVDLMSPGGSWEITNMDSTNRKGDWRWLVRRYPEAAVTAPPAKDWPAGTLSGAGVNVKIGAGQAVEANHGAWWRESSGCNAYVDKLTIGYLDTTGKEVVTTYDFEAE